jgi:hypothetical protein
MVGNQAAVAHTLRESGRLRMARGQLRPGVEAHDEEIAPHMFRRIVSLPLAALFATAAVAASAQPAAAAGFVTLSGAAVSEGQSGSDLTSEPTELPALRLTAATNTTIADGEALGLIVDDD